MQTITGQPLKERQELLKGAVKLLDEADSITLKQGCALKGRIVPTTGRADGLWPARLHGVHHAGGV